MPGGPARGGGSFRNRSQDGFERRPPPEAKAGEEVITLAVWSVILPL